MRVQQRLIVAKKSGARVEISIDALVGEVYSDAGSSVRLVNGIEH
jgi:hypothetical protein